MPAVFLTARLQLRAALRNMERQDATVGEVRRAAPRARAGLTPYRRVRFQGEVPTILAGPREIERTFAGKTAAPSPQA